MKLLDEFNGFVSACYAHGVIPEQREQLLDSFMAGALVMFNLLMCDVDECDQEETVRDLAIEFAGYKKFIKQRSESIPNQENN